MDYGEFIELSNQEDWSDQYVNKLWDTIEKLQSMTLSEFESNSINYDNIYEFWNMKDRNAIVHYSEGYPYIFINFRYLPTFIEHSTDYEFNIKGLSYLVLTISFKFNQETGIEERFNILKFHNHSVSLRKLSSHLSDNFRTRWAVLKSNDAFSFINWINKNPFEVKS